MPNQLVEIYVIIHVYIIFKTNINNVLNNVKDNINI